MLHGGIDLRRRPRGTGPVAQAARWQDDVYIFATARALQRVCHAHIEELCSNPKSWDSRRDGPARGRATPSRRAKPHPGVAEAALARYIRLPCELLCSSLIASPQLEEQAPDGGALPGIDVSDDCETQVAISATLHGPPVSTSALQAAR